MRETSHPYHEQQPRMFYGNSGKLEALNLFLEHLLTIEQPKTLYINADDNCEWFFNDITTGNYFTDVMNHLVQKGCTIIHLLPPATNDYFLDTFINWLPLYMSEKVIPYTYPRYKNESFRFFMLAMENEAALVSYGIYKSNTPGFAFFSTDSQFVETNIQILSDYKALCRPALNVHKNNHTLSETFRKYYPLTSSIYILRSYLPMADTSKGTETIGQAPTDTFPFKPFSNEKSNIPATHKVVELCRLATANQVRSGKVRAGLFAKDSGEPLYHTVDTYKKQLQQIVYAMEQFDNYLFIPLSSTEDIYGTLFIQQGISTLLLHDSPQGSFFEIQDPGLVNVLEEYIFRKLDAFSYAGEEKQIVMHQLKNLIKALS